VVEVLFSSGQRFSYPAEYLRVYSPAADSAKRDAQGRLKVGQLVRAALAGAAMTTGGEPWRARR
jgi:DUF971 family protein